MRQRNPIAPKDNRLNFSSSDYLSLKNNKDIKAAYERGFNLYPVGSTGSMVVCGYHENHKVLETHFAKRLGCDDALVFSSGFAANLSIVSLLAKLNANILIDKSAHASFYDGLALAKASYQRYLHQDLHDLSQKLDVNKDNQVVITESIFSMSGSIAELSQLVSLAKKVKADCIVDEAHAFGVIGDRGLGLVNQENLSQNEVPLRLIPFGKAFASQGAVVAGKKEWIEALLQVARPYIYSTGISPALTYGLLKTFDFIYQANERREKLQQLIHYFRQKIAQINLKFRDSLTPIQQLQLGDPKLSLKLSSELKLRGILCQAMRQPTVTKPETGLRIILNYHHEYEDIDYLFENLLVLNERLL
ncbi:MAG: pyridoxal phosphate-dependent aminotransferase family protein [Proteobacteria bacterium]|nr:pyridoxal phosphate-dependent aminotransferase family protein [Pseudomonadota bacterium]